MVTLTINQDLSGFKNLKKELNKLKSRHIKFGWINGKKYPASHKNAGKYIASIAVLQEYGFDKIPRRAYFRQMINTIKHSSKYRSDIGEIFVSALHGNLDESKLNKLAQELPKDYNESVLRQNKKPLAEYTVSIKGHTFQMDHTGYMLTNFSSKVFKQSVEAVRSK